MGTNPNKIYELSKITKMAVYYSENQNINTLELH